MATKKNRIKLMLACTECKHRNYSTTKNIKTQSAKLSLRKYCAWCRSTVMHKETK